MDSQKGQGLKCAGEGQSLFSSLIMWTKDKAISRVNGQKIVLSLTMRMTRETHNGSSHTTPTSVGLFSLQSSAHIMELYI